MKDSLTAAAALGALVMALMPASAARGAEPGVIGADDRVPLVETGPPWTAVGQVNIGGYRRVGLCTGTLVAPDLVITAAHCLVDRHTGRVHPARHVHFVTAVDRGAFGEHATARCVRFLKDYRFVPTPPRSRRLPESAFATDVAAILLETPLTTPPAPVAKDVRSGSATTLAHAAYPADRRFRLTAHVGCRLLPSEEATPLWRTDCDTHPASSGGPVFVSRDGTLALAAVMVAVGTAENIALPIAAWRELLDDSLCP